MSDNDVKISALQALGEKSRDDGEPIGNVGEKRRSAPQGGGGSGECHRTETMWRSES